MRLQRRGVHAVPPLSHEAVPWLQIHASHSHPVFEVHWLGRPRVGQVVEVSGLELHEHLPESRLEVCFALPRPIRDDGRAIAHAIVTVVVWRWWWCSSSWSRVSLLC